MGKLKIKELRKLCKSQLQLDILEELKNSSKTNRVTREYLEDVFSSNNRTIRNEIYKMRANGIPIATTNFKGGYYLPKNWEEYVEFSKAYCGRAYEIIKTQGIMQTTAESMFGNQIGMKLDGK